MVFQQRRAVNPFYWLLVVSGIGFAITASAYAVMCVSAIKMGTHKMRAASRLMEYLDARGHWLMAGELAILLLACLLAMGTDSYWETRFAGKSGPPARVPDESATPRDSREA